MAEIIDLSQLISNPGYDCIIETIFSNMDPISLATCRLVSKSCKALIDRRKSLLIRQLQQLKKGNLNVPSVQFCYTIRRSERKCSVIDQFQELKQAFMDIEKNANGQQLKIVVDFMRNYSKHRRFPLEKLNCSINGNKNVVMSPLHLAIKNEDEDFVKIVMKKTKFDFLSRVQFDDQIVTTFLGLAVNNQAMVLLFLNYALEKGINMNIPDSQGQTAFHYACLQGKMEVVKCFMENVDKEFLHVDLRDQDGHSPLHLACIGNNPKTVRYLFDMAMQFGIDVNATDRNGWTLLHLAAKYGHHKVALVILEASFEWEINTNAFDFENKTPFTISCINGHLEVAKLMIQQSRKYGINLNLLDFQGNSAMHYAIKNQYLDIARVMIDESNDKDISLNQENDIFVEYVLEVNGWVNSVGGLIYGRRPDLWNPLSLAYFFANHLHFSLSMLNPHYALFILILVWSMIFGFHLDWLHDVVVQLDLFFNLYGYELNSPNEGFKEWLEIQLTMANNQCHHQEFDKLQGWPLSNIFNQRFVVLNWCCKILLLVLNYISATCGIFIWLKDFQEDQKVLKNGALLLCILNLLLFF